MPDYPSNSIGTTPYNKASQPTQPVNPVVQNPGVLHKKKSHSKLLSRFIAIDDIGDIKTYVLDQVLIPNVQKALIDTAMNFVGRIFYGKGYAPSSQSGYGYSNGPGRTYVSYNAPYTRQTPQNSQQTNSYNFENISFLSAGDAEATKSELLRIMGTDRWVPVSAFYQLARVPTRPSDYDYGWDHFDYIDTYSVWDPHEERNEYYLRLPRPIWVRERRN